MKSIPGSFAQRWSLIFGPDLIAAGSVITEPVSANAMALGRARQTLKPGRAATFRAAHEREKA
jgi:bifunctional N-acetylglucosamine-1-phosphate-uridyltransferase/glucosamine-1-phosphate-acetyltransferase GlmU-like protein